MANLATDSVLLVPALAGMVLLLALGWWGPTVLFLLALLALAVRPEAVLGGPVVGTGWVFPQSLVVIALAANALRYGIRPVVNWPLLALTLVFALNLVAADLHPKLTVAYMGGSLVVLALPWLFTQVVLAPGSRQRCALAVACVPLLSVALGTALQLAGIRPMYGVEPTGAFRLHGTAGIAADLALLGFAGFAAALHESTRTTNRLFTYLTVINLVIVILSGTRMAIAAGVVLFVTYCALLAPMRARLRTRWMAAVCAVGGIALVLGLYLPHLGARMFAGADGALQMSGREATWGFYVEEFLMSPLFGRGLGAGFLAYADYTRFNLPTPHNEYLHLLVSGGVVGFLLMLTAIGLWFRQLAAAVPRDDRAFLLALMPALALYAVTENVLLLPTALPIFAYLGVLRTKRMRDLVAPRPERAVLVVPDPDAPR